MTELFIAVALWCGSNDLDAVDTSMLQAKTTDSRAVQACRIRLMDCAFRAATSKQIIGCFKRTKTAATK